MCDLGCCLVWNWRYVSADGCIRIIHRIEHNFIITLTTVRRNNRARLNPLFTSRTNDVAPTTTEISRHRRTGQVIHLGRFYATPRCIILHVRWLDPTQAVWIPSQLWSSHGEFHRELEFHPGSRTSWWCFLKLLRTYRIRQEGFVHVSEPHKTLCTKTKLSFILYLCVWYKKCTSPPLPASCVSETWGPLFLVALSHVCCLLFINIFDEKRYKWLTMPLISFDFVCLCEKNKSE